MAHAAGVAEDVGVGGVEHHIVLAVLVDVGDEAGAGAGRRAGQFQVQRLAVEAEHLVRAAVRARAAVHRQPDAAGLDGHLLHAAGVNIVGQGLHQQHVLGRRLVQVDARQFLPAVIVPGKDGQKVRWNRIKLVVAHTRAVQSPERRAVDRCAQRQDGGAIRIGLGRELYLRQDLFHSHVGREHISRRGRRCSRGLAGHAFAAQEGPLLALAAVGEDADAELAAAGISANLQLAALLLAEDRGRVGQAGRRLCRRLECWHRDFLRDTDAGGEQAGQDERDQHSQQAPGARLVANSDHRNTSLRSDMTSATVIASFPCPVRHASAQRSRIVSC
jgi:hypothetical protein